MNFTKTTLALSLAISFFVTACDSSSSSSSDDGSLSCSVKSSGNSVTFSGSRDGSSITSTTTLKDGVFTTTTKETYATEAEAKEEYEDLDQDDVENATLNGKVLTYTETEPADGMTLDFIKTMREAQCNEIKKEENNQKAPEESTSACNFKMSDKVWKYTYSSSKISTIYTWVDESTVSVQTYMNAYHLEEDDVTLKDQDRETLYKAVMDECKIYTESNSGF